MPIEAIPQGADVRVRIEAVRRRIVAACERAGRNPAEVTLVAVTKTVPPAMIQEAFAAGVRYFGENRVREAATKISSTFLRASDNEAAAPQWHLIGHLQTNKAKKALELFQVIQSVDSLHLAEVLQHHAAALKKRVEVFIEINTSGEASKFGAPPNQAAALARQIATMPNLQLTGLMTIGALTDNEEIIRRCFRKLHELRAEITAINVPNVGMLHLSMGMTDDFELAIAEGSTMVRVGRAIFGARP
jgi:pyridoxal phosphate enzyme (YggS family)